MISDIRVMIVARTTARQVSKILSILESKLVSRSHMYIHNRRKLFFSHQPVCQVAALAITESMQHVMTCLCQGVVDVREGLFHEGHFAA